MVNVNFQHKNFGLSFWRIFVFGVLSVTIFLFTWMLSTYLFPVHTHGFAVSTPEEFIHAMFSAFVATLIISSWGIRHVVTSQRKYEDELEAVNKKLRELAVTDAVTGVYNHRYFEIMLEKEWQKMLRFAHPLACVILDLDDFKRVNDDYGHQAGDFILRSVAEFLHHEFREIDIVSRYGGEEFAVIMVEKPGHLRGLRLTMERIRKKLATTKFQYGGHTIRITASLGGALAPNPKLGTPAMLVNVADRAMYLAKKAGKNRVKVFEGRNKE